MFMWVGEWGRNIDWDKVTGQRSYKYLKNFCSDFRYESNGIFVLGVGFFSSDKFFLTSHFWRIFLNHWKGIIVLSLNLKRYFTCDYFS